MSKLSPTVESRKTLYYNKYKYKANFSIQGIQFVTRSAYTLESLNHMIKTQADYYERYAKHMIGVANHLQKNKPKLVKFINWRTKNLENISIRSERHMCSVFSNDLNMLKTLSTFMPDVKYTEVELEGDPAVIELLNPKHKFRVYFKNKSIKYSNFIPELRDFLKTHEKSVCPCRALNRWIEDSVYGPKWRFAWLSSSYFLEYDHESTETLMNLFLDGYLSKTFKVVMREK